MNYELDADELIFTSQNNVPTNIIGPINYQGTSQGIFYPTATSPTQYLIANPNVSMTNFYGNNLNVSGLINGTSINTYSSTVPTNVFKNMGTGSVQTIASSSSASPNGSVLINAALNDTSSIVGSNFTFSNGVVTVLTSGLYEITAEITYGAPITTGLVDCIIDFGTNYYNYLGTHTSTVATTRGFVIPEILQAGETVSLYGYQNSGSTVTIQSATLIIYKVAEI